MEHLERIYKQKIGLFNYTKKIYEDALKLGFSIQEIVDFDFEQERENLKKLCEKFGGYEPFKTTDQARSAKKIILDSQNNNSSSKFGDNNDFKNLMTERINESYSFGKYGDYKIVMHNESGYVNGT